MSRILVCDDDKDIVAAIRIYLMTAGYEVLTAENGQRALDMLKENEVDLLLLDIMMPVMDGIEALEAVREISNIPVILLTAKSEDGDIIEGLTVGADDYVTKPFRPMELLARVRSQLRRYQELGAKEMPEEKDNSSILKVGGIVMNDSSKEVSIDGESVSLTPTEYNILKFFMENPSVVYSPEEIYSAVWQGVAYESDNTVAVHIRHIREKIEIDPSEPRYLKAVWGRGYKLDAPKKGL